MSERLTEQQLGEIAYRLRVGLNDEGLRAWYPTDVGSLLREVFVLRHLLAEQTASPMPIEVKRPRGRPRKVRV